MTLNDADIEIEILNKEIVKYSDKKRIKGACYELRMGRVYYDLTEGAKWFSVEDNQPILIKPGHRVVLMTIEELNVPNDMLVRVVSKGSLFSIGLTPVATYADPGFKGNIGIVTQNISDKFIELPRGEPIAKADFTRLSGPALHPYDGQHGFQSKIWPIKTQLQREYRDVASDPRVLPEIQEALALLPLPTRTVIQRLENTQLWTLFAVFIAIIMNSVFIILISGNILDQFYGIVGNLLASAVIGIGAYIVNRVRRVK